MKQGRHTCYTEAHEPRSRGQVSASPAGPRHREPEAYTSCDDDNVRSSLPSGSLKRRATRRTPSSSKSRKMQQAPAATICRAQSPKLSDDLDAELEREMDEWALASGVSKGPCCPAESEAPTWNAATAANSPLHDESVSPLFPRDFVPPPLPDSADPSTRSSASSPAAEALALGFLRDASGAFIAPKEWIDAADSFKAPSGVSDRATYARAARAYKARRADLVSMNAKLDSVRSRIAVLRSCQEGAAAKELFELVRPAVRRIEAAASKLHGELQATRRRVDAFKRLLG